jgi:DNA-directed RNA polymerase subunit beta
MKKENFGKIIPAIDPPLLLEMQKESFAEFLQQDVPAEKRKPHGLEGAFRDVFPLTNSDGSLTLEFVSYALGEPKYSEEESIARDATYAAPLKILLRLIQKQENGKTL